MGHAEVLSTLNVLCSCASKMKVVLATLNQNESVTDNNELPRTEIGKKAVC